MVYICPGGNCTGIAIFFLTKCHIWNTLLYIHLFMKTYFTKRRSDKAKYVGKSTSVPQANKNYIVLQSCQQVIDRGNGFSSSRLLAQPPPPRMQENPPCLQGGQFVVTKRATVVKKKKGQPLWRKVENMMIFWKILQQQFFDQEQEFNNINTISYMNVLMARVDQYISGDHKSSQVTPRLQLISVAEVQDCICCCFLWTQTFCNLYHGEGCACYTNEMVRLDLVKQNYRLKYHLQTQHHFFTRYVLVVFSLLAMFQCTICAGLANVELPRLSKIDKMSSSKIDVECPTIFPDPKKITTKSDVKITSSVVVSLLRKEWFYYNLFICEPWI